MGVRMYQSQIAELKQDIIENGGFETCKVLGSFSGIEIKGVRKLPENINQGRHHLFIDLEDYRGLDYWIQLNNKLPFYFNKPKNEVASHIDIYGSGNSLRIFGTGKPETYSQTLTELNANHTAYGHSSYYIYAIKTTSQIVTPVNEALQTIQQIEELLKHLKGLV